jgi:hypothetical protein
LIFFKTTVFDDAVTKVTARIALGATTVGNAVFTAATSAAARLALGATTIGDAVFIAANEAAARAAIGAAASPINIDLTSIAILPGYLFGCTLSTAGASTTMSISAGQAQNSTGSQTMVLAALAKTTSNWAAGTATGGKSLATAIANNTWYHWYVIRRPDTGDVDVCFSTNAAGLLAADFVAGGGNVPDAYTQFRRIGSGKTNGSAQWTAFIQDGDTFSWVTPVVDVNSTNPTNASISRTLSIPLGVRVLALTQLLVQNLDSSNVVYTYLSDLATTDTYPPIRSPICLMLLTQRPVSVRLPLE